jgi:hypothetical protein
VERLLTSQFQHLRCNYFFLNIKKDNFFSERYWKLEIKKMQLEEKAGDDLGGGDDDDDDDGDDGGDCDCDEMRKWLCKGIAISDTSFATPFDDRCAKSSLRPNRILILTF